MHRLAALLPLGFVGLAFGIMLTVLYQKHQRRPGMVQVLLLTSVFGAALVRGVTSLVSGLHPAGTPTHAATIWTGRASTGLLAACLIYGLASRRGSPPLSAGQFLPAAALAFIAITIATEALTSPSISTGLLLLLLFIGAVSIAPPCPPRTLLVSAKVLLAAILLASLVASIVFPQQTWQTFDHGTYLPGIDVRLTGVAAHPNTLGLYCALLLALELALPSPGRLRLLSTVAASGLLVLSQSKTSLAAGLGIAVIAWVRQAPRRRRVTSSVIGAATITIVILLSTTGLGDHVDPSVDLRTLTGRVGVWEYGLQRWTEAPLIGGGAMVFTEYAHNTGQTWAAQSHNQFIETLSRHGIVGFGALLAYLAALGGVAWHLRRRTAWASIGLLLVLYVRLLTETPLRVLSPEHATVLLVLSAWAQLIDDRIDMNTRRHPWAPVGAGQQRG